MVSQAAKPAIIPDAFTRPLSLDEAASGIGCELTAMVHGYVPAVGIDAVRPLAVRVARWLIAAQTSPAGIEAVDDELLVERASINLELTRVGGDELRIFLWQSVMRVLARAQVLVRGERWT